MDANNRESAADVANASVAGTAARMKGDLADKAADAKEAITDLSRQAADKLDSSRESTARALNKTATSLHSGADQFSDLGHLAADRLQATAEYVRETDLEGIFLDLQSIIKRNPTQSMVAAGVLGFLLARGLSRSDR